MKISDFLSENFHFFMVKFSNYLNRRVFVMNLQNRGCFSVAAVGVNMFTF